MLLKLIILGAFVFIFGAFVFIFGAFVFIFGAFVFIKTEYKNKSTQNNQF